MTYRGLNLEILRIQLNANEIIPKSIRGSRIDLWRSWFCTSFVYLMNSRRKQKPDLRIVFTARLTEVLIVLML